jgi:cell division protein FtsA
MEQRYIVAVEIGSSKIKGAIGTYDNSNTLTVLALEEEKLTGDELGDSVRYGVIQNVDKVTGSLGRILRKLESWPNVAPRHIKSVYTAVGGRSTLTSSVEVSQQHADDVEITEAYYTQLKHDAVQKGPADRDIIDVVTREFLINNMSYKSNPVGLLGSNIKATFNLVTCRPALRRNINRVITERLGLNINGYIPRSIAEANLVLTDEEKRLGCMLVDFGAETVSVAIYKNGTLAYASTLPIGSRNITRDLMTLNFTEERAEETKKVAGNADTQDQASRRKNPDGLDYSEINSYVAARAGEIVSNILEQITYAELKAAEIPGGIVVVGGGAKLKGFCNLLTAQSNMKVRVGTPSGLIRIGDARIQAADSVDVIAILNEAARMGATECTERPIAQGPQADDNAGTTEDDVDGESGSRIGGDFIDKPSRETKSARRHWWGGRKTAKTEDEPDVDEEQDVDDGQDVDDEPEETAPRSKLFSSIKNRVIKLMTEGDDDKDDGYTKDI